MTHSQFPLRVKHSGATVRADRATLAQWLAALKLGQEWTTRRDIRDVIELAGRVDRLDPDRPLLPQIEKSR